MSPDLAQESQALEPFYQWKMQKPKHLKYKGFMLIKCQHCGELKGFCAKTPIDTYTCSCGGKTPIQKMAPAVAKCECEKNWSYQTNADNQMLEINCFECGSPIDLKWNLHKGILCYFAKLTITEKTHLSAPFGGRGTRRFYENHEKPVDLVPDIAIPRAKSGDRNRNVFSQVARVVDCGQIRYEVLG